MPNKDSSKKLPPLSKEEKEIQTGLEAHVKYLARIIGERNVPEYSRLKRSAKYIEKFWKNLKYDVKSQVYQIAGKDVRNLYITKKGTKDAEDLYIVIGAHYDTAYGTPGANDNGSGVAALLELSRLLKDKPLKTTLNFVAFVNEEPPYFQSEDMGSYQYAKLLKEKNIIVKAMYSLETMGFYTNEPKSQNYPFPLSMFYPSTGNFIAFVGNKKSKDSINKSVKSFKKHSKFPVEGAALFEFITGIGWSDQWSFWQMGYPGMMVTDTAFFRYEHYHQDTDTWDRLNYPDFARVTSGFAKVLEDMAELATEP
jgi:Zn-dependent M28 family amino/carboxypeptidase